MASANHISKKAKDAIAKVDSHKESKAKADTDDEKKKSKKGKKRKKVPVEEDVHDEDTIDIRDVLDPEKEADVPKSKKRKTDDKSEEPVETKVLKYPVASPYRPVKQNDWLYHIAGITISSCLKKAMDSSSDPRVEDEEGSISWSEWSKGLFSESDLKKIWWYIRKQYPSESFEDVMKGLSGLSAASVEKLKEEATKKKYQHLAPKQPLSPYMAFYHRKSQKFYKKHPKMSQPEIARKMGEIWRQMNAEEKEKYQEISRQKREIYKKELEEFHAKYPEAAPKNKKKKSTTVSASQIVSLVVAKNAQALKKELPKAPLSPYIHFCKEMRPRYHKMYSHLQPIEITRKLGAKWSSMTPKEKEKYVAMQEKERESYDKRMEEFYAINPKIESLVKPYKSTKKKKSKVKSKETVEEEEEEKEIKREEVEEDKDDNETSDDDSKESEEEDNNGDSEDSSDSSSDSSSD